MQPHIFQELQRGDKCVVQVHWQYFFAIRDTNNGRLTERSKNKTPVLGNAISVLGMKLKRG